MGSNAWLFWALASAGFASLTAILFHLGILVVLFLLVIGIPAARMTLGGLVPRS